MILTPLAVSCPQCGSYDVFYSCKPECCFNHVCNQCYTTFELGTTRVGEWKDSFLPPPDPDPSGPTAPCARCGEYKIFAISDNPTPAPQYLCIACKALLNLEVTNVAKG